MRKEKLSRVYLDDYPITLMGDESTPPLSRIVRAGGKRPDRVDVIYLTSPADRKGRPVDPETIIDRTAEPTRPIYLRTLPKPPPVETADRPPALPPEAVASPPARGPMAAAPHEAGVFRSPSQGPMGPARPASPATVRALRALALANAARLAAAQALKDATDERDR